MIPSITLRVRCKYDVELKSRSVNTIVQLHYCLSCFKGFDGGDCCPCTCMDDEGPLGRTCGESSSYDCIDPGVPDDCGATPSPAAAYGYPDCTGYIRYFQNGRCNDDLNNSDCGYDGGDCCR